MELIYTEIVEDFFNSDHSFLIYSAIGAGVVLFVFLVCDVVRQRRKKDKRPLNFHYSMTGRVEDWSKKCHDESSGDKSSRKSPKRKSPP